MPKFKVTFDFGGTEEVSADTCTQDPMWTTFHNRPHSKNEDSFLVASFRSAIISSVINKDL